MKGGPPGANRTPSPKIFRHSRWLGKNPRHFFPKGRYQRAPLLNFHNRGGKGKMGNKTGSTPFLTTPRLWPAPPFFGGRDPARDPPKTQAETPNRLNRRGMRRPSPPVPGGSRTSERRRPNFWAVDFKNTIIWRERGPATRGGAGPGVRPPGGWGDSRVFNRPGKGKGHPQGAHGPGRREPPFLGGRVCMCPRG